MGSAIGELITELRGARSYDQLAQDCGGTPTQGRIQQMVTRDQNAFPSPESIRGLARGLGVRPSTIVQAVGEDLGLWARDEWAPDGLYLPEGTKNLTAGQRSAVVGVIRELVAANERSGESGAGESGHAA